MQHSKVPAPFIIFFTEKATLIPENTVSKSKKNKTLPLRHNSVHDTLNGKYADLITNS